MTTDTMIRSATGYLKAASTKLPTFALTVEQEDRAGDIVEIAGLDVTEFKKNPVALWSHQYAVAPVGIWENLRRVGRELLGDLRFDMNDPFAAQLAGKVARGFISAVSIGFRPLKATPLAGGGRTFTKAELLEVSLVAVPMNQAALRKGLDQDAPMITILPSDVRGGFVASRTLSYADLMRAYQRQRLTQAWRQARPGLEADAGIARGFDNITRLARRIAERGR